MDFEALERLGRLRASGAISEDEFESEKQRLLGVEPEPHTDAADIRDVQMSHPDDWQPVSGKPSKRRS